MFKNKNDSLNVYLEDFFGGYDILINIIKTAFF